MQHTKEYEKGKEVERLRKKLGSIRLAADDMGIPHSTARRARLAYLKTVEKGEVKEGEPTVSETDNGLIAISDGETVKTLDQLIAACKIDLELWRVDKWEAKSYQAHRKSESKDLTFVDGKISGRVVDGGDSAVVTMYTVKAWMVRREEKPFEEVLDGLLVKLTDRPKAKRVKRTYSDGEYLLVPGLSDIHIGRLSMDGVYTPEVARKDMDIAGEAILARVKSLGMKVERIMLPVGNDMLNADNLKGTTTKGTWQDMAAGQRDAVDAACQGYIDMVERLLDIAPVDVVLVEGNHDRYSVYWLGKVLESWFTNHKFANYVSVDNKKSPRKYYVYANNLIGMEHGDELKAQDLALVMAQEAAKHWSATKYHTWLRGHFHKERGVWTPISNHGGVHVDFFPAFCPPSEWELLSGYIGTHRAADVRFFHKQHGRAGSFPVFIDEIKDAK